MARSGFDPVARERIRRRFKSLPDHVRRASLAALEQNADELTEAIRRVTPVAKVDGGELQASVRWRHGRSKQKDNTGAKHEAGADTDMVVRVIAGDREAFYAPWVEHGRRARGAIAPRQNRNFRRTLVMTKGSKAVTFMQARPFFFPTFRANKKRLINRMFRQIRRAIRTAK